MKTVTIREKIESNKVVLGFCMMYPIPGAIERIGADWDWIWIDGQHGQHNYESILACVRASDFVGIKPIVRVPGHEYGNIGLALDTGAAGVMVPMINNIRQAQEVVNAAKFPPIGNRSYGARRLIDLYGRGYSHTANEDTILIAQIETMEGVENCESIADIPGIDVLFFSPDDMAMHSNMQMDKPRNTGTFLKEMERVAKAASEAGKYAGTVTTTPEAFKIAIEMGYRLLVGATDVSLLVQGSKSMKECLRGILAHDFGQEEIKRDPDFVTIY